MNRILLAGCLALIGIPAPAQDLAVTMSRTTCQLMVIQLRKPELLRGDVSVYLQGLFDGAAAHTANRQGLRNAVINICNTDPTRAVDSILRLAIDEVAPN